MNSKAETRINSKGDSDEQERRDSDAKRLRCKKRLGCKTSLGYKTSLGCKMSLGCKRRTRMAIQKLARPSAGHVTGGSERPSRSAVPTYIWVHHMSEQSYIYMPKISYVRAATGSAPSLLVENYPQPFSRLP